jgi:hypothetical protein
MNEIKIESAQETLSTIKIGLKGPSGSGKTYSALLLAHGLVKDWSKILVIDTERSVGLYKRLGNYSKITLTPPFSTARFLEAFRAAVNAGFKVIIFDSISHWWSGTGGILESNAFIEENFCKGNSFKAWLQTNKQLYMPLLQETILQDQAHVIFTMRSKVKYVVQQENNKTKIEKRGTKEDMRDGFDYELSIVFDIDQYHVATPSKDRTSLFDGERFIINEGVGEKINQWLQNFSNNHNSMPTAPMPTEEPKPAPADMPNQLPTPEPAHISTVLPTPPAAPTPKPQDEFDELVCKIMYYMPALEEFNKKAYARLVQVLEQKDEIAIKKAAIYIDENKAGIEAAATNMVRQLMKKCEGKCEEEKAFLKKNSPQILKDNPYFLLI